MRSPHLQTILPRFYRKSPKIIPYEATFELTDGDFVELSWSEQPPSNDQRPLVILFHGLAGSIDSFYANGMMKAVADAGWLCVLMHFRGCGKKINRLAQAYHCGATEDAAELINHLKQQNPTRPLIAIGFSLGGNMLAKYLGQTGKQSLLDAAIVISAPLLLSPCAKRMTQRFSRVYQKYLLDRLKVSMIKKLNLLQNDFPLPITSQDIRQLKTIKAFDDLITGPLHGFTNAEDYYRQCSGLQFLKTITTPTLIIHAADDPFMTSHVQPTLPELSPTVCYEISQRGGHVGFIHGKHPFKPQFWLEQRVPAFIRDTLAAQRKPL